jgi:hypothetical protein
MIRNAATSQAGSHVVRTIRRLLVGVATVAIPACAPEGAGSISADPARTSNVMVAPVRKASMPLRTKARSGRTAPGVTSSKR